jgi:CRP-like cAMP-binding protein
MPTSDIKSKLIALLPQLGASGVEILVPFLTELRAEKGHVMVKQGDKDEDMYFLLNGVFSVFEKIQINRSDVVLHTATFPGPGILGEVSIMTDAERTATVVVMDTADCLVLTKKKFDQLVGAEAKVAIELLKTFGAVMYGRQTSFQNRVRGNILRESRSSEGGIAKLARYTGKVSRTSAGLAEKLFSEDFKGVNYDSHM